MSKTRHSDKPVLTEAQVREILRSEIPVRALSERYKTTDHNIRLIKGRKTWSHLEEAYSGEFKPLRRPRSSRYRYKRRYLRVEAELSRLDKDDILFGEHFRCEPAIWTVRAHLDYVIEALLGTTLAAASNARRRIEARVKSVDAVELNQWCEDEEIPFEMLTTERLQLIRLDTDTKRVAFKLRFF